MRQVRQGPGPNFMTFLADEGDNVMFEIYKNPDVETPDYFAQDPMVLTWLSIPTTSKAKGPV